MRSSRPFKVRVASASLAPSLALAFCLNAFAADAAQPASAQAPVRAPALGAPALRDAVAVPLNQAITMIGNRNYLGALLMLADADAIADKTPTEEYAIAKYLVVVFLDQPMPDMEAARGAYNRQVASHGCPDAEQAEMYRGAMQMNAQAMDDTNVILDARELAKLQPLREDEVLILANAYFRASDFSNAAAAAKAGIDAGIASRGEPNPDLIQVFRDAEAKLDQK